MIYPWQHSLWQALVAARPRMPHALLLQGQSGIGKLALARTLAQAMLCDSLDGAGLPCGRCSACNWFEQGYHPDFRLLEPQAQTFGGEGGEEGVRQSGKKGSRFILMEQIRELADFVNLTAHRNGMRVILIHPAEAMNINVANALLKTLEEPAPDTLFLLVAHQPHRLLATLKSRCHRIDMPVPASAEALRWLEAQGVADPRTCLAQSGYAPLAALHHCAPEYQAQRRQFLEQLCNPAGADPLALAEMSDKLELPLALNWLQKWLYDLLSLRLAGKIRYQVDFAAQLQELAKRANLLQLLEFQRELLTLQKAAQHPLNLQLQLEQVALSYLGIFSASPLGAGDE